VTDRELHDALKVYGVFYYHPGAFGSRRGSIYAPWYDFWGTHAFRDTPFRPHEELKVVVNDMVRDFIARGDPLFLELAERVVLRKLTQ
jgi:hypothetical protein